MYSSQSIMYWYPTLNRQLCCDTILTPASPACSTLRHNKNKKNQEIGEISRKYACIFINESASLQSPTEVQVFGFEVDANDKGRMFSSLCENKKWQCDRCYHIPRGLSDLWLGCGPQRTRTIPIFRLLLMHSFLDGEGAVNIDMIWHTKSTEGWTFGT